MNVAYSNWLPSGVPYAEVYTPSHIERAHCAPLRSRKPSAPNRQHRMRRMRSNQPKCHLRKTSDVLFWFSSIDDSNSKWWVPKKIKFSNIINNHPIAFCSKMKSTIDFRCIDVLMTKIHQDFCAFFEIKLWSNEHTVCLLYCVYEKNVSNVCPCISYILAIKKFMQIHSLLFLGERTKTT